MPRQLKILKGPSFKSFVFGSDILSGNSWTYTFTTDQEIYDHSTANRSDKHEFSGHITTIGRSGIRDADEDDYTFIVRRDGEGKWSKIGGIKPPTCTCEWYYYVGHYNTRTRTGECVEYLEREFFSSQVMRNLYKRNK